MHYLALVLCLLMMILQQLSKYYYFIMAQEVILEHFAGRLTFIHPVSRAMRCGTAILLSENVVITPAHNVYDREGIAFYSNYQFEIGKEEPVGVVGQGMMQNYASAISQKKSNMYDFAVLYLERSVKSVKSLSQMLNSQGKRQQLASAALEQSKKSAQDQRCQVMALQEQLQAQSLQVLSLRQRVNALKGQIVCLSQTNKNLEGQIIILLARIDQLTLPKQQDISFSINQSVIKDEIRSENADNSMEQSCSMIPSFALEDNRLAWDFRNPSVQQFYQFPPNSSIIKCRIGKETNWNRQKIISCQPGPHKGRLIVKSINYASSNSSFSFGIMSKTNREGQNRCCVEYHLSNSSNSATLLLNGEIKINRDCDLFLRKGEKMCMKVDLDKSTIMFGNPRKSVTLKIPAISSTTPLYPFLMLWNKGDEVSLSLHAQ